MHWISLVKLSVRPRRREERTHASTVASTRTTALATVFWCLLALSGTYGLEIKDVKLSVIAKETGSTKSIVLDCDYKYTEEEKSSLVVKWYRELDHADNRTDEQVYQWIALRNPQDLGVLKGRLNIKYEASPDPFKKHRALNILNPTTNLTGVYKCHVSTNDHDAYKWSKIVIYSPGDVSLKSFPLSGSNKVNVSCTGEGIYPKPSANIYIINKDTGIVVDNTTQLLVTKEESYDITVYKIFDDSSLAAETVFECELKVPEARYEMRKQLVYYPGHNDGTKNSSDAVVGTRVTMSKGEPSKKSGLTNNSPNNSDGSSTVFHHSIGIYIVQLATILLSYIGHQ